MIKNNNIETLGTLKCASTSAIRNKVGWKRQLLTNDGCIVGKFLWIPCISFLVSFFPPNFLRPFCGFKDVLFYKLGTQNDSILFSQLKNSISTIEKKVTRWNQISWSHLKSNLRKFFELHHFGFPFFFAF